MPVRYYRPRRKADLVRHLEEVHVRDVRVPIVASRWTVAALAELHDGLHAKALVPDEAVRS